MFTKIRENLYLSSHSSIRHREIEDNRINAIVNVANEISSPSFRKVASYHCGFDDNVKEAQKHTDDVVAFVNGLLKEGKKVLVHCNHGASRSPHIIASVLAESEGRDYDECYKEVKQLHPRTMDLSIGEEMRGNSIWG